MSASPLFDPFPDMPNVTDLGDGRRLIETHDKGHCLTMVEPNGDVSVVICKNSTPPPKPAAKGPSSVCYTIEGQEILDSDGGVYATTKDPAKADHIRKLLSAYDVMMAKKAASGA